MIAKHRAQLPGQPAHRAERGVRRVALSAAARREHGAPARLGVVDEVEALERLELVRPAQRGDRRVADHADSRRRACAVVVDRGRRVRSLQPGSPPRGWSSPGPRQGLSNCGDDACCMEEISRFSLADGVEGRRSGALEANVASSGGSARRSTVAGQVWRPKRLLTVYRRAGCPCGEPPSPCSSRWPSSSSSRRSPRPTATAAAAPTRTATSPRPGAAPADTRPLQTIDGGGDRGQRDDDLRRGGGAQPDRRLPLRRAGPRGNRPRGLRRAAAHRVGVDVQRDRQPLRRVGGNDVLLPRALGHRQRSRRATASRPTR